MKGAISYSLFGYNKERQANCFDFNSYLRGMHLNVRFNKILFPGWNNVINLDSSTYNSPYKKIFDWHVSKGNIKLNICPDGETLCKAMLWRLKPIFFYDHPEWTYSHVICRDLDSIATYREAQMVAEWIKEDKTIHCITDSVSHTIPMMGGMIGFRPSYISDKLGIGRDPDNRWNILMSLNTDIDFNRKGSDQDFLNRYVYPKCSDSATEHFIKGMQHNLSEINGRHYHVPYNRPDWIFNTQWPNEKCSLIESDLNETNLLAGHVGAAGFYEAPTMKFLYYNDPYKQDYQELETMPEFSQIFYWSTREDLR